MVLEHLETHMQKKLDSDFTPFIKINSKWIKMDVSVKHKTIKLLEDNIGETLDDLGYSDAFIDVTSKK